MVYAHDEDGNDHSSSIRFTTEKSKQNDDWDGIVRETKADRADVEVGLACQSAMKAWQVLRCRDGGRVDIRMDHSSGNPVACVLEVGPLLQIDDGSSDTSQTNPLVGQRPKGSQLPLIAEDNGVSFDQLMEHIVTSAMKRARG